jgi:hypothetical protein
MKTQKIIFRKIFLALINLFIVLVCLFQRSFVGLNIKGILIGEAIVGFGLLISCLILLFPNNYILKYNISKITTRTFKLIVISFILSSLFFDSSYLNTYIYKTSSYIWTIGYLFLSVYIFNKTEDLNYTSNILRVLLPLLFLFSTGYYPDKIIVFFNTYSDKFQFPKASDILIVLVITNLLNKQYSKKYYLVYLFATTGLFLPLFLFQSRGTFVAAALFLVIEIFFNSKIIFQKRARSLYFLITFLTVFTLSSFHVSGLTYEEEKVLFSDISLSQGISESIIKLANKNDQRKVFLSFFYMDGRLYSEDTTTNWRLDIWQDVIDDLDAKNQIFYGYGYNEIIPPMLDLSKPGRLGRDGNNENVHNYFINILARGGLLQLFMFVLLHLSIFMYSYKKSNNFYIISLMIPSLFNGLTDINFEGVQFPLLYYGILGYFIKNNFKIYNSR